MAEAEAARSGMKDSEHLDYRIVPKGGQSRHWAVHARNSGAKLGDIKWFNAWRRYVYYPEMATLYDALCLRDIAGFCDMMTKGQFEIARARKG